LWHSIGILSLSLLRELISLLGNADQTVANLKRDLSRLNEANIIMQEENNALKHREENMRRNFEAVESENKKLVKALEQSMAQLNQRTQQMSELQERNEFTANKCAKREASATNLFVDLQKSLETIKKLEIYNDDIITQNETYIGKLKDQQDLLDEKDKIIVEANKKYMNIKSRSDDTEAEVQSLRLQLETTSNKLKEESNKIVTKDTMIQWLNKKLAESEKTAALLKSSPLTAAYLPDRNLDSSLSDGSQQLVSKQYKLVDNKTREGNPHPTSTPITGDTLSQPLRKMTLANSLVWTSLLV